MSCDLEVIYASFYEVCAWLSGIDDRLEQLIEVMMDKKIKELQKGTKKLAKQESELLKADKKRDKACDMGEKMMKGKKK